MPDLLLLEQRFNALQEILRVTSSPRMRLVFLLEFGEQFRDPGFRSIFSGYAPELLQEIGEAGVAADFQCTPLPVLIRTAAFLSWADREVPGLISGSTWESTRLRLAQAEARARQWVRERGNPRTERAAAPLPAGTAWIPLVELERLALLDEPAFACLRRLVVRILPAATGGVDEVQLQPAGGTGEETRNSLLTALAAARACLKALTGADIRTPLLVSCRLEGTTPVTGHSLEAGLAAAILTALAQHAGLRRSFALREDVAITGRISADGMILPVERQGLRPKIDACTWSWIQRLVVPQEQGEEAGRLAALAPGSAEPSAAPVGIAGATRLEDLFRNPRITTVRDAPLARHVARVFGRNKTPLLLVIAAVALTVAAVVSDRPRDTNPVSLTASGELLLARNRAGEILDTLVVGQATAAAVANRERVAVCADVDGDGLNEVVWGQASEDPSASDICCRGLQGDGPVWRVRLKRHLDYAGQPVKSDGFALRMLSVVDIERDGAPEVLVLGYHPYFPSILLRLDAATGRESGCYVHAGHLLDMAIVDLDGDSVAEILLAGINNSYGEGVLAVLGGSVGNGAGPSAPAYAPLNYPRTAERWYVRIPRTVVGLAVPAERFARAFHLDVYPSERTFRVTVQDQATDPAYRASIDGLFDFSLRPLSFDGATDFDAAAARLYREGRIPRIPDKEYFDRFRSSLQYWDGSDWTRLPTRNSGYPGMTHGR
jgi:hypothetical protein